jgi:hypothetical protein
VQGLERSRLSFCARNRRGRKDEKKRTSSLWAGKFHPTVCGFLEPERPAVLRGCGAAGLRWRVPKTPESRGLGVMAVRHDPTVSWPRCGLSLRGTARWHDSSGCRWLSGEVLLLCLQRPDLNLRGLGDPCPVSPRSLLAYPLAIGISPSPPFPTPSFSSRGFIAPGFVTRLRLKKKQKPKPGCLQSIFFLSCLGSVQGDHPR